MVFMDSYIPPHQLVLGAVPSPGGLSKRFSSAFMPEVCRLEFYLGMIVLRGHGPKQPLTNKEGEYDSHISPSTLKLHMTAKTSPACACWAAHPGRIVFAVDAFLYLSASHHFQIQQIVSDMQRACVLRYGWSDTMCHDVPCVPSTNWGTSMSLGEIFHGTEQRSRHLSLRYYYLTG